MDFNGSFGERLLMKIYNGHFYNADCLEVLKTLDNQSIDLVVTSPPYDDLRS